MVLYFEHDNLNVCQKQTLLANKDLQCDALKKLENH